MHHNDNFHHPQGHWGVGAPRNETAGVLAGQAAERRGGSYVSSAAWLKLQG